jgi:hypothetical protein
MQKTILLLFYLKSYAQYFEAELHFMNETTKNGIARINTLNDKTIYKDHKNSKKEKYNHKNSSNLILKKDSISHSFRYKKTLGKRAPKLLQVIIEKNNLSLCAIAIESNYLHTFGLIGALATKIVDANKINYEY